MGPRTPTDAEPLRLAYWQGVHCDAIVSPKLVPRRRRNKPEAAIQEKTRGQACDLHDKKMNVGRLKHKKVCDESLLQPGDHELLQTRSMCSMSEGGVLPKPVVFTTFDRHWQAYRRFVVWLLERGKVSLLSVMPFKPNLRAFLASLESSRTSRGGPASPGYAKSIFSSLCVITDCAQRSTRQLKTKKAAKRQRM